MSFLSILEIRATALQCFRPMHLRLFPQVKFSYQCFF
eukprot:UN00057